MLEPVLEREHALSLSLYATIHLEEGRITEAGVWFIKALSADPTVPAPFYGLGECALAKLNNGDTRAKAEAIGYYEAYLGRARTGGHREKALHQLRILKYGETSGKALNQAIRVWLIGGQPLRAERMLRKLTPKLKEADYWLGEIAQDRADIANARMYWKRARPFPLALLALGKYHLSRGEYDDALKYLQKAKTRSADLIQTAFYLGRVYLELGRADDAKKALWQVVNEAPQLPEYDKAWRLLWQLGEIQPELGPISLPTPRDESDWIKEKGGVDNNPVEHRHVEELIERLRKSNPGLRPRPFRLVILKSDDVNAWACRPNKIYITRGLLQWLSDEAEFQEIADDVLAFIIGHEITHLVENHANWCIGSLNAILGQLSEEQRNQRHRQEYTADRRGTLYAYQAGFEPYAGMLWLRASENRFRDSAEGGYHPTYRQRQSALSDFLADLVDAHQQFKRGVALMQQEEFLSASYAFESYLSNISADIDAQYNVALAYFYLGIGELGSPPWKPWKLAQGVSSLPQLPVPIQPRSKNIKASRQFIGRAKREAERIVRQTDGHAASWRLLGDIALAEEEYNVAREHYQRALSARPGDGATHNNLGVLAGLQGNLAEAQRRFDTSVGKGRHIRLLVKVNLTQLQKQK